MTSAFARMTPLVHFCKKAACRIQRHQLFNVIFMQDDERLVAALKSGSTEDSDNR